MFSGRSKNMEDFIFISPLNPGKKSRPPDWRDVVVVAPVRATPAQLRMSMPVCGVGGIGSGPILLRKGGKDTSTSTAVQTSPTENISDVEYPS